MRFISIFTHEPTKSPPTEAEMATMGKLIEESMKAGWLIATEGVHFSTTGVRVQQECQRQGNGHRRPLHRDERSTRRLRSPQSRKQGRGGRAHAAFPRRSRPGNL